MKESESPFQDAQNTEKQKELGDAQVTPQAAPADDSILSQQESVEYRDQDGHLLDEDQVAALQKDGNISFKTRYETRTKLVDEAGNEIVDADVIAQGVAPPHPDVEGRNPETIGNDEESNPKPATASVDDDVDKEKSVENKDQGKPRPASEGNEATKQ